MLMVNNSLLIIEHINEFNRKSLHRKKNSIRSRDSIYKFQFISFEFYLEAFDIVSVSSQWVVILSRTASPHVRRFYNVIYFWIHEDAVRNWQKRTKSGGCATRHQEPPLRTGCRQRTVTVVGSLQICGCLIEINSPAASPIRDRRSRSSYNYSLTSLWRVISYAVVWNIVEKNTSVRMTRGLINKRPQVMAITVSQMFVYNAPYDKNDMRSKSRRAYGKINLFTNAERATR